MIQVIKLEPKLVQWVLSLAEYIYISLGELNCLAPFPISRNLKLGRLVSNRFGFQNCLQRFHLTNVQTQRLLLLFVFQSWVGKQNRWRLFTINLRNTDTKQKITTGKKTEESYRGVYRELPKGKLIQSRPNTCCVCSYIGQLSHSFDVR